jgi:hypothetical protein
MTLLQAGHELLGGFGPGKMIKVQVQERLVKVHDPNDAEILELPCRLLQIDVLSPLLASGRRGNAGQTFVGPKPLAETAETDSLLGFESVQQV